MIERKEETASRINLIEFLENIGNQGQLIIPVYQRHYVWTSDKHVKRLLADFEALLDGEKNNHFVGIIMYSKIYSHGFGSEFLIIDGQQRITTFFLMLHALKDIAHKNNDTISEDKIEKILFTSKGEKKLKPLKSEDDIYDKIISGKELSKDEKNSNMYQCFQTITKFFERQFNKSNVSTLIDTFSKIDIVSIALIDSDEPQEIFETINSAGRELSKSDLIRNYVLMKLMSDEQESIYNNLWIKIEKLFEKTPEKIEMFFRYFLANKRKDLPDMNLVYDAFKEWFDDEKNERGNNVDAVKEIVKEIYEYANYYYNLYLSDKKYLSNLLENEKIDKNIFTSIREYQAIRYDVPAPILLEVYHLYSIGEVSSKSFSRIIKLFITYYMRRNLVKEAPGTITRDVPIMLKNILSDCDGSYGEIDDVVIRWLVDNNENKKSFMPTDKYMKDNIKTADAYALKNYVKLAFEKIESYNNSAVIDFDETKLSIEHLLPQTPTEERLKATGIENIEEYKSYVHRLGNLTLSTQRDNSRMSNNIFEYKKKILEGTNHLKINTNLINKPSWNVDDINQRTDELIDKICEIYPYETAGEVSIKKYKISYKKRNCDITAYLYDNMGIEIMEGSYFEHDMIDRSYVTDLIEAGILQEHRNGYIFIENYQYKDFEYISIKITGNLKDPWNGWQDEKGRDLSFELKAKILNKNMQNR